MEGARYLAFSATLGWIVLALIKELSQSKHWGAGLGKRVNGRRLLFVVLVWEELRWLEHGALGWLSLLAFSLPWVWPEPLLPLLRLLGAPRATYWLLRVAGHSAADVSPQLGPAFEAARALLRRPSEAGARFIEQRLTSCTEHGTLGAGAAALIALARGQRERAVAIFRGIDSSWIGERSSAVLQVAREGLVLDAAARGNWRRVSDWADAPPYSALTRLLGDIANRVEDNGVVVATWRLWWRWLLAPARRQTLPWVRRALRFEQKTPPLPASASLTAQAAVVARFQALTWRDVAAAVSSLDALRNDEKLLPRLEARALSLGLPSGAASEVRETLLDDAAQDLAQLLVDAEAPAGWIPAGESGTEVRERKQALLFDELEDAAQALKYRIREGRDLPEADEWQAWGELVRVCDTLLRDAATPYDFERIFTAVHRPIWSYAWYQGFPRGRRRLARAVFQKQRYVAHAANSNDAYATIEQNLTAVAREWLLPTSIRKPYFDSERLGKEVDSQRVTLVMFLALMAVVTALLGGLNRDLLYVAAVVAVVGVVLVRSKQNRLVAVFEDDDGLTLQTLERRYVAPHVDVEMHARADGMIELHLLRSPFWLSRTLFTFAASDTAARASIERFEAARARFLRPAAFAKTSA